jgi:hypothetical protein
MKYFTKIVDSLIKLMIPLVILALMMGVARLMIDSATYSILSPDHLLRCSFFRSF